jgi:hypothetical protein
MCEAIIMTNSSISVLDNASSTSANIAASTLENKTARSFFDRAVFFGLDRFSKYFYFYFYFYFTSNGFVTM